MYGKLLTLLAAATLASAALAAGQPALAHSARPGAARKPALLLLTEPKDGIGPIYRLISRASTSIDLTMYELADPVAERDLAAAQARGVRVRVLLDLRYQKSANRGAYRYLARHGVQVRWATASRILHQKTLTVDDATSVIMTLNLVRRDYPGTRDFAVVDTRKRDVAAIVATFNADFAHRAITPPLGADLVWSPTNAQAAVLSVIRHAHHTLALEQEEMADPAITRALAAAAARGVDVKITMTADSAWDHAFSQLARAGAHIRLYPYSASALYIHAKVIVADAGRRAQRVLIGSQNFSVASLGYNRELGIVTRDRSIVASVAATLARDFAAATAYRAPKHRKHKARAAWCRARATVYNASEDENNVYVHSNQRHKRATASADGYSHSWRTNGHGYALIYLNGPPPGALITVRVGGATCTTRD
jgi:cardiolipin synthase